MREMKELKTMRASIFIVSFALLSIPRLVSAQDGEEALNVLDEVIVTARKREETLQESPVAISAFSAESLKEAGIGNTRDLERSVPSLNFLENAAKSPSPFIRGIGQRENYGALDPGVGVYINGIYIPRTDSQLLDSVDTESIQVLRGPQGTLFGKNNTGGAILVTTVAPTVDEFKGYVEGRVGNFGRKDVKVGANIPLNEDSLAMRVTLSSVKREGYLDNVVDGKEFGDEDRLAASARFAWQPTDVFYADVFTYVSKINENGLGSNCVYFDNPDALFGFAKFVDKKGGYIDYKTACNQSEALAKDGKVAIDGPSQFQMTNGIAALTLSWELDDIEVKSITAYSRQWDLVNMEDSDASAYTAVTTGGGNIYRYMSQPVNSQYDVDPEQRSQFSQELQIIGSALDESLSYTAGAFYSDEKINNMAFVNSPGGGYMIMNVPGVFPIDEVNNRGAVLPFVAATYGDLSNEAFAIFAQGTYDVNDYVQLTLGARYTVEKRERSMDYYSDDLDAIAGLLGGTLSPPFDFVVSGADLTQIQDINFAHPLELRASDKKDETFRKFTPMATLAVKTPDDMLENTSVDSMMTYLTVSTGFKAGGFETKGSELEPFDEETLTNIELGIKVDAYDQRLRFNTALFRMKYDDMQVRVVQNGAKLGEFNVYIVNAGSAIIQGAELELSALVTRNFTLMATANYTDAFYEEFSGFRAYAFPVQTSEARDRSKEPYPAVPPLAYSLTAMYAADTAAGVFSPRLSMIYHDGMYTGQASDDINFIDKATTDDVTLWDFRMGYIPAGLEALNLSLYVKNLTDEEHYQGGISVGELNGSALLAQGPGREYGLEATYNF